MRTKTVQVDDDGQLVAPTAEQFRNENALEKRVQNQTAGSGAPGVNDDSTQGYEFKSLWVDTSISPPELYKCLDATEGAAVWVNTSLTLDELGSMALEESSSYLPVGGTAADVDPAGAEIAAALAGKVGTTGDESIAGVKTFTASPIFDGGDGGMGPTIMGRGVFARLDKIDDDVLPESDAVFEWRRKKTTDASVMTKWQAGIRRISQSPEEDAWIHTRSSDGQVTVWVSFISRIWTFIVGIVSPFVRAADAAGLALQDSAGTAIIEVGNSANTHQVKVNGVIETGAGSIVGSSVTAYGVLAFRGTTEGLVGQFRRGTGDIAVLESTVNGANLLLRARLAGQTTGNIVLGGLGEAVELPDLTASLPLALDASKNVISPTAADFRASIEGQRTPVVVSSSITAELDGVYHGVAAATYTDPTVPAEGRGFVVRVVNGAATVGGVAFAVEGTVISREYHSDAWRTRVLFGGADAAAVRGAIGAAAIAPITSQTITANTTISPTIDGATYKLTLEASPTITLDDFPSATQAATIKLIFIQDGTGDRVATFAGNVTFPGGVTPTFSASADAVDTKTFQWDGAGWQLVNSTFDQG